MSLRTDFEARFPNMFPQTTLDLWFPIFEGHYSCYLACYVTLDYNNQCDKEIVLLLIAHLIRLAIDSEVTGGDAWKAVTSTSVGSVSESYGGASIAPNNLQLWPWLQQTFYGQMLEQLLSCRLNRPRALIV